MHTIKPLDQEAVKKSFDKNGEFVFKKTIKPFYY